MNAVRQDLIAVCLAASMTMITAPAVADGAGEHRCCGWFPQWFPHWIPGLHYREPAYPAYYAGPLSGATYEYYYSSNWGRPYVRAGQAAVETALATRVRRRLTGRAS